jgi:hypothetical protein
MIRAPILDDIEFDALFEQGRALIPRFAPEWTDHNLHDPGITLLDLLAWLVDIQVYRIGFVGSPHFAAFAALFGVYPRAASAAHGLLWPNQPLPPVRIADGSTATTVASPDVPFRVSGDIDLSPAKSNGGTLLRKDGTALAVEMNQRITLAAGDRLELKFDRPLAVSADKRVALGFQLDGMPVPTGRNWGPIAFDYKVASEPGWQPVSIIADGTKALSQSGVIILDVPPVSGGSAVLRLRLDNSFFPVVPTLTSIALNVLPVEQVVRHEPEVLGRGNGQPDQEVTFDWNGILLEEPYAALKITSDEDGSLSWREVDDLSRCGPAEAAFVRDAARNCIRFGNGLNGRNPGEEALIRVDSIDRTRGEAGNLGRGRSWRVAGISGDYGVNQSKMSGGRDADTIEDLLDSLRLRAVRRDAMVTDWEMRAAATKLPGFGIERADVLPRFWPDLPGQKLCGARTLIVRPASDPKPPRIFLDSVRTTLEPFRLLGERLFVISPGLVSIQVSATVQIGRDDSKEIEKAVTHQILARLNDRKSMDGIEPWPLGRQVTVGELESIIAVIPGVRAAIDVRLARIGEPLAAAPIDLSPDEIAVLAPENLTLRISVGHA